MSTTMDPTRNVLAEIEGERMLQLLKWGNDHDDEHTIYDWVAILTMYSGNVAWAAWPNVDIKKIRGELLKVATIAVAALEAIDRAIVKGTIPGRGEPDPKEE